jgi:hypothetical protein
MKNDPRHTITPPSSGIAVTSTGFTVSSFTGVFAEMAWDGVKDVFAYTRFLGGDIHLCLAFAPKAARKGQVVVNERVRGWEELLLALPEALGDLTPDWVQLASCDEQCRKMNEPLSRVIPDHVVNPVHVWPVRDGRV